MNLAQMVPPLSAWKFGGDAVARYMQGIFNNALSGTALPPSPSRSLWLVS